MNLSGLVHPKAVLPMRMNGHLVSETIISNIVAFATFYVLFIIVSVMVVNLAGMNLEEAIGAVVTSISNVDRV